MTWNIIMHPDFAKEFEKLSESVQDSTAELSGYLAQFGPQAGRPWVDTLKGSKHSNMKELRFKADDGVWRIAFAFDPERQAVLLVAGDKSGTNQQTFYKKLIQKADKRFTEWLET